MSQNHHPLDEHHAHDGHHHQGLHLHSLVEQPQFSLLRLSAIERLTGVAVLIMGLWTAVWWALS